MKFTWLICFHYFAKKSYFQYFIQFLFAYLRLPPNYVPEKKIFPVIWWWPSLDLELNWAIRFRMLHLTLILCIFCNYLPGKKRRGKLLIFDLFNFGIWVGIYQMFWLITRAALLKFPDMFLQNFCNHYW